MPNTNSTPSAVVPVTGLAIFAIASGYLMSVIPLSLTHFALSNELAAWLTSIFYLGLMLGSLVIEPIVNRIGHRLAFIVFLSGLIASILLMVALPVEAVWLGARFAAGFVVAGIFVVVESWLLISDNAKSRAKRLGLYMVALYGGTTLGQLIIGFIGTQGNVPYFFICGLLLCAILPPLLIRKGQPPAQEKQELNWKEVKSLNQPAVIGCLVSGLTMGPIYGLMPLYIQQQTQNETQTGFFMAMIILGGMLVQPMVSYLSPKMNKSLLMGMFSTLGLTSIVLLQWSPTIVGTITGYLLLGASTFALYPIAITLACDGLNNQKVILATQFMLLSYSIGSVFGPGLYALLKNHLSLLDYLIVCLLMSACYMFIRSMKRDRDQSPMATQ